MIEIRDPHDSACLARAMASEQTLLADVEEELLPRIAELKNELAGIRHEKDLRNRCQHPVAFPVIQRQRVEGA